MTASDAIMWSAVRSIFVGLLSLPPAILLWRCIQTSTRAGAQRSWMILSILPFFVPELLIGFTYRIVSARLVHSIAATEALYCLLLTCRAVSMGVIALLIMQHSNISRESIRSWRMIKPSKRASLRAHATWTRTLVRLYISGPYRPLLVAGCLSCLITFKEFETAALMQIDRHPVTWTVWLFDAHAAHQPLSNSLMMSLTPLLLQSFLLIPVFMLWPPGSKQYQPPSAASTAVALESVSNSRRAQGKMNVALCVGWMAISATLFLVWPVASNAGSLLSGLSLVTQPSGLLKQSVFQIATSLGFASAAAIIALQIAVTIHTGNLWNRLMALLLIPGLLGSLVTCLTLLAMFQTPLLNPFYDTWLPLLLGLSLTLLPRAFLMAALLHRMFDASAWHSAALLSGSPITRLQRSAARIHWRMKTFAWVLAFTVLCHWCFWDVTTASILRPVQLEPIITRLYNEMHYGRTEALVLITTLSALAPWLTGAFVIMATAATIRLRFHRAG